MGSNNHPEASQTEGSTPAPRTAAITEVRVGDQHFELRGLSTANGVAIYNALPQESKQQADAIAGVVGAYQSVVNVAMRYGNNPTDLALEWIRTRREDGSVDSALENASQQPREALRALDSAMASAGISRGALVDMVPGGREVAGVASGISSAANAGGAALGMGGALADGAFNGPGRIWNWMTTLGREGLESMTTNGNGIDPDQARAFGAVVAALRLQQVTERHGQPMFALGRSSQALSNMMEYGGAGVNLLGQIAAQHIPFADVAITAFRMIFNNPEGKGWSQLRAEVRADIDTQRREAPVDLNPFSATNQARFTTLADAAMVNKEGARARDALLAAGEVAGISTAGVADLATAADVTYRDQDGRDIRMTGGNAEVVGDRGTRIAESGQEILGDGPVREQILRAAGSVGTTAALVGGAGALGLAGVAAIPGMSGAAVAAARNVYETAPMRRGMGFEGAAERNHSARRLFDPRTWFNSESRGNFREGQAATEYRVTAERTGLQPHEIEARVNAQHAFGGRVGFRESVGNFFRNPFRSTAEGIGGLFGHGADGADRAGRGIANDFRMIGNDARGIASGVNPGFAGAGKTVTRVASFSRFLPRGLGIFGTVAGAAGDTMDGVDAAQHGDGRGVARAGGRVAGGIAGGVAGGAAAGAAAGAAIGIWFGGIGAIPAGLIGGAIGMAGAGIGGWLGSSAGGAVSEATLGGALDSAMGTQRDARGQVVARDGALGQANEELARAAIARSGAGNGFARVTATGEGARYNEDGSLPSPARPDMREQRQFVVS